jgi:hypothetical protein
MPQENKRPANDDRFTDAACVSDCDRRHDRGSANHRRRACVAKAREVHSIDSGLCIHACLGLSP